MAVDAYALTTLDRFKDQLEITTSTLVDLLETLIDAASDWIETYCDRKFMSRDYTEYTTGHGTDILPKQWPVTAVTSINYDTARDWDGTDVDSDYIHIVDDRWIYVRGYDFSNAQEGAVKLVYTAGYSTVPDDLQYACDSLVAQMFAKMKSKAFGKSVQSMPGEVGGSTTTYIHDLPPDVKQILEGYKSAWE